MMPDFELLSGEYRGNNLAIFTSEGEVMYLLSQGQYERIGIVAIKTGIHSRYGRPRFKKRPEQDIQKESISRGADVLVNFKGDNGDTVGLAKILIPNLRKKLGLSVDVVSCVIP